MAPRDVGPPERLSAYAERRIKLTVASGTLKPGSRLSPAVLAEEYGLSHIPVREALASLAAAGYVNHSPGRGFSVKHLNSEDLADIYHWRQVLEDEAYRLAVPKLTDADLTEMRRLLAAMDECLEPEGRLEFIELNREFHFIPFRRTGSDRLLQMLGTLWDAAEPYASLEMTNSVKSQRQHTGMMPLLESRDVESVIAAMGEHRGVRLKHVSRWEADHAAEDTKAPPRKTRKARQAS